MAARLGSAARRAVVGASGSTRLDAFVELFLEALSKRQPLRAPGTIAWYEDKLGYVTEAMGSRRLAQISGGMLTVFYGRLLDRGLSPTTVSHTHGAIRACPNQAVRWGYITDTPALQADPPGRSTAERTTWSADELRRFLESRRRHALACRVDTSRRHRNAPLGSRRVPLEERRPRQSGHPRAGSAHVDQVEDAVRATEDEGGVRSIAIDSSTTQLLAAHRRRQITERLALGDGYDDQDLVNCWEDGKPVNPDILSRAFRRLNDRLGLLTSRCMTCGTRGRHSRSKAAWR